MEREREDAAGPLRGETECYRQVAMLRSAKENRVSDYLEEG
jgi:hypothetical protein